jgi:diguanylate cyclase (GGDEF)-like protein/PAS domain S-box-containing protein
VAEAHKYRDLFQSAPSAYVATDAAGVVRDANRAAMNLFRVPEDRLVGRLLVRFTAVDSRQEFEGRLAALLTGETVGDWEVRFDVGDDGGPLTALVAVSVARDRAGGIVGHRWVIHDVTERKRIESRFAHMAFHDGLTGLANKALFEELLTLALARAWRDDLVVALLYLDLDGFKVVNDGLGHASGDDLLRQVAGRLVATSRPADAVARLGGDEFAVLLADLASEGDEARHRAIPRRVAARIRLALRAPYALPDGVVRLGASIGIGMFPNDASNERELMKEADAAMYRVKRARGYAPPPTRAHPFEVADAVPAPSSARPMVAT